MASFTPSSNYPNGNTCTATITTEVNDLAGNALASTYVWTFYVQMETTPTPIPTPAPLAVVNLGRAVNFGILAGTGLSNTNPTTVTGDVGVGVGGESTEPSLAGGYTNYLLGEAPKAQDAHL